MPGEMTQLGFDFGDEKIEINGVLYSASDIGIKSGVRFVLFKIERNSKGWMRKKFLVECRMCKSWRELHHSCISEISHACQKCSRKDPTTYGKWKGGVRIQRGYYTIHRIHLTDDEYALVAHRWPIKSKAGIMEHVLLKSVEVGRQIDGSEEVHHVNGETLSNHDKNLQLCPTKKHHFWVEASIKPRLKQELIDKYKLLDEHGIPHEKECIDLLPTWYQVEVGYVTEDEIAESERFRRRAGYENGT